MILKMKQNLIAIFSAVALLMASQSALAATAPNEMVKSLSEEVLTKLRTDKEAIKEQGVENYVSAVILPHFNFDYMAQLVLGKYYRKASDKQKTEFTSAFKSLLINTYAGSLLEYQDEKIDYLPYHEDKANPDLAKVSVEIVPAAGPAIPMDYSLQKEGDSWKVFDVSVDGLSMVTNYRRSFGKKIKKDGIDALISSLVDKVS